ncbi:hypothetical protein IN49_06620 [Salmonella enterica]|nr:hypothetical protein IN49_06620 [Salmonella enterica]
MQRLSPLTRGTRYRWRNAELLVRFIPAGAGNTINILLDGKGNPVYPRWRGEHGLANSSSSFSVGLSPLARGTH